MEMLGQSCGGGERRAACAGERLPPSPSVGGMEPAGGWASGGRGAAHSTEGGHPGPPSQRAPATLVGLTFIRQPRGAPEGSKWTRHP